MNLPRTGDVNRITDRQELLPTAYQGVLVSDLGTINAFEIVGIFGFLTYALSFGLLQLRWVTGNGVMYCGMNMLAAAFVLVSLIDAFNLASMLISVAFLLIGFFGVVSELLRRRRVVTRGAGSDLNGSPEYAPARSTGYRPERPRSPRPSWPRQNPASRS